MKQWVVLIVSVCIIIFSGIYEVSYLRDTSSYLLADIEYCRNAVENNNFSIAKDHVKDVYSTWNYLDNVWSIFIDHDEMGNIKEEMLTFKLYIENENKEEAIIACRKLEQAILHSVEKQELSISNVF